MGDGLVGRVSRRFGGERFVSLSGEMSIGSSTVEDLGLGVPFLKLSFETELKLGVLNFPLPLPFPWGGVGSFDFSGDELLLTCSVAFLGGVGEEVTALPSPPFVGELAPVVLVLPGEGLLLACSVCAPGELGSGLRVLPPAPFDEGLGEPEDDFFAVVLVGEAGRFGDFVFCASRVSHNVAT